MLNKNTIQQFEREYIPLTEQELALQQKPAHYTVGKFITSHILLDVSAVIYSRHIAKLNFKKYRHDIVKTHVGRLMKHTG